MRRQARISWILWGALQVALACSAEHVSAQACVTPPTFAGLAAVTNAKSSSCAVQLSWSPAAPSCGGAIRYAIFRGTSSDFTPSAENRIAASVYTTTYTDDATLTDGQTYWYVVRASEIAAGVIAETNTVRISSIVTGPVGPAIHYFDDFDGNRPANAGAYFAASSPTLGISTCNPLSPTHAYWFGAVGGNCTSYYPQDSDAWLVFGGDGSTDLVNGFAMPSRFVSGKLSFYQSGFIEAGYDFVDLFYSTSGATGPWTLWATWTGLLGGTSELSLAPFAEKTVWFAWRYRSDSIVEFNGMSLDDVRISVDALTVCSTFTPPPRAPHHVAFNTQPSDTVAGAQLAPPVTVSVLDDRGNLVSTPVAVRLTLLGSSVAASLLGSAAQVTVGGIASFPDIAVDRAGQDFVLRAAVTGLDDVYSVPFDVGVATSDRLVFVAQPTPDIVAGTPFGVEVVVQDPFGNTVTSGAPLTISLALEGGTDVLGGTTSVDTLSGRAVFDDLVLSQADRGLTLRASASAFIVRSAPFAVVPAPASTLALEVSAPVHQGQTTTAKITARDAFGNIVSDDQSTVTLTSSDAHSQLPAPIALYDGRAQVNVVFGTSGTQTLTVTDAEDAALVGSQSVEVTAVDRPTVTILTPRDGEAMHGKVQIVAAATVGSGTSVARLSVSVDGEVLETTSGGVLTATWSPADDEAGTSHVITAEVTDEAGNVATSLPVTVTIAKSSSGGCATARPEDSVPVALVFACVWLARARAARRGRAGGRRRVE